MQLTLTEQNLFYAIKDNGKIYERNFGSFYKSFQFCQTRKYNQTICRRFDKYISHKTIYVKIGDNSCFYFGFDNKFVWILQNEYEETRTFKNHFWRMLNFRYVQSKGKISETICRRFGEYLAKHYILQNWGQFLLLFCIW